ncbi:hypothetical protein BFJ72_g9503 [Fusarium proliferatum]|uniref:Uncharacterized protein n=1 Tax=Gibberella intermedia TaxID=948311 RepID=A0A420SXI7_GIBIN|nr:hypothetical protein BFJ72_g9503 [Fusarium proliferatum]
MALSTATLGATNNDIQLMGKSQQAYGLAMQQMATSFISPSRNKDGILAAIQLMRVYEQLFGTGISAAQKNSPVSQIKGFRKHIDGETALILSRGPEDSWSAIGRQLLADGRLTLVSLTSYAASPAHKYRSTHTSHDANDRHTTTAGNNHSSGAQ